MRLSWRVVQRLRLEEIGEYVVPAPADTPSLCPVVIVGSLAAHIDLAIYGRTSAECLACGPLDLAQIDAWVGFCRQAPIIDLVPHQLGGAGGHVDKEIVVFTASLKQDDAVGRILAQARGKNTARATAADDHIVRCFDHFGIFQGRMAFRAGLAQPAPISGRLLAGGSSSAINSW